MSDLIFSVSAISQSAARVKVSARDFQFLIDEPPVLGGDDLGANPVEYVLGALTGCLNVVAHLVAKELGIAVRSLKITASGDVNPARLLQLPGAERAGYKSIQVQLDADTDASPELLEKWLAIVESRCPVSDNLLHVTPVELRLRQLEAVRA